MLELECRSVTLFVTIQGRHAIQLPLETLKAEEEPLEGRVASTGPGKRDDRGERIAMQVKEGNKVLFAKYGGTEIKISNVDHIVMREDDILAIIDK